MFHLDYTSKDSKQQQRMFPPRPCAVQDSWTCLAHSCLLFYSCLTSWEKRRRRETSTGTPPEQRGTRKSMMKHNPFPKKRKEREEGRQAPEPSRNREEPVNHDGTETPSLRKERKEKKGDKHRNERRENKGDKHRNPSRNQEEPPN